MKILHATHFALLLFLPLGGYASCVSAETGYSEENATAHQHIKLRSVRSSIGNNDPMMHMSGQIRSGYISLKEKGESRTSAYALGGHFHFETKRWQGLMLGAEAYTVLNLGINQNPLSVHSEFFDDKGKSFITLSQAYLDGEWGETSMKLGRQIINTPHADSDDIRMMPNYFEAFTLKNTSLGHTKLCAGFINKMAGWENGANSADFVNIGETLGTDDIDGLFFASASYEGIKDLSLSFWFYRYTDIADIYYAEAAYVLHPSKETDLTFGLQYDASQERGAGLLGEQDSRTWGISAEIELKEHQLHVYAAYNQDHSHSGASSLSLGGGPFFTSMEDQTLDAIEGPGEAWIIGTKYSLEKLTGKKIGLELAYGEFSAKEAVHYDAREADLIIDYTLSKKLSLSASLAYVDFQSGYNEEHDVLEGFKQIRIFANYNL